MAFPDRTSFLPAAGLSRQRAGKDEGEKSFFFQSSIAIIPGDLIGSCPCDRPSPKRYKEKRVTIFRSSHSHVKIGLIFHIPETTLGFSIPLSGHQRNPHVQETCQESCKLSRQVFRAEVSRIRMQSVRLCITSHHTCQVPVFPYFVLFCTS